MESKPLVPSPLWRPLALVARELARALLGPVALAWRVPAFLFASRAARAEFLEDLAAEPDIFQPVGELSLPDKPLCILISCAEASGEIHALNLVTALRQAAREAGAPEPEFLGLGGPALAAQGVEILGDPVSRSTMGFAGVIGALPFFVGLVLKVARRMCGRCPDIFVPVDSPALHLPLARIARSCSVPVVHFVTPQYWGWAPWRVGAYGQTVNLALSILPFEPAWFARRAVTVAHVGHPLLDELGEPPGRQQPRADELCQRVVVLPGSRAGTIRRNLPSMLSALELARGQDQELEVVVVQRDAGQRELVESILQDLQATGRVGLVCGGLEEELGTAQLALSVSGTVLLDLLHQRLPAVVVYRAETRRQLWLARHFLTTPWFSSVNLLAGREVYPEFFFQEPAPSPELLAAVARGLGDGAWRAECSRALEEPARRLGPPGATRRAALAILGLVQAG